MILHRSLLGLASEVGESKKQKTELVVVAEKLIEKRILTVVELEMDLHL
jgi:hypothetical protein